MGATNYSHLSALRGERGGGGMTVEEALRHARSVQQFAEGYGVFSALSTLAAEVERLRGALDDAINRAEAAEQAAANLLHAVDTRDEAKAIRVVTFFGYGKKKLYKLCSPC